MHAHIYQVRQKELAEHQATQQQRTEEVEAKLRLQRLQKEQARSYVILLWNSSSQSANWPAGFTRLNI